ncbi:uncharacterized protein LOC134486742 isoform X2 [Rattus norvegicus]|uniref:uncharacterized protein LOC134486742 isoform X2 n=1 Tax=Rattus norvegicus TaxID=10116 RepID=UPI0008102DBA|eukprot:XP_017448443.1 PREDICTED: uncharacterized protein LOC108350674 isoform X1 [Rattus norvegicus]
MWSREGEWNLSISTPAASVCVSLSSSPCIRHPVSVRSDEATVVATDHRHISFPHLPRAFGDPESSLSPPPFPHPRVHPAPSCCVAWAQIPGAKFPELGELSTKMPEAEAPTARVPAAPAQAAARTFPGAVSAEPAVARSRVLGLGALLGLRVRGKPCCSRASSGRKLSEEPRTAPSGGRAKNLPLAALLPRRNKFKEESREARNCSVFGKVWRPQLT